MKIVRLFMVLTVMMLILVWLYIAFAEQSSITLPKGTKVEKIGPGHFKFRLPNRQIVEVKNFNPRTGAVSYVSIINPDPTSKPVAAGKQGAFKTSKKLTMEEASKLQSENYIMIDDDPTWLPATISYQHIAISDPDPPPRALEKGKTKELSPQPDPPGRR